MRAALQLPAQERRAITWDDFAALRAVADPQVSPDGRTVLRDAEAIRRRAHPFPD